MVKRFYITFLVSLWCCSVAAGTSQPNIIRDLQYGEVLFHFYQQDYFTSLTNLMIADQNNLFKHHQQDVELLKGGLQLSYGMDQSATAQFASVGESAISTDVRNRISYYLGRIQHQRGDYSAADNVLQTHTAKPDDAIYTQLALLHTNNALARGRHNVPDYETGSKDDPLTPYLRLSKGVTQIRSNNTKAGWATLGDLGTSTQDGEEALALRDRTNLGLGYEFLRNGDFEKARDTLDRVRLDSPFTNAALLGAGWADAERDDYDSALQAWLYLFEQTRFDSSVHEAHLAVPYALMKTGNSVLAIDYYHQAVDYFDAEQQNLQQAESYTRSGAFLPELRTAIPASSGGWLIDAPKLEQLKIGRFLPNLLAEHRFHEPLKDFRDLGFLIQNLEQWRKQIDVFSYMVSTRRLAYEEKAPALLTLLESDQAQKLTQRYQALSDEVALREASGDPLAFRNTEQAQQWDRLERVIKKASELPRNPRIQELSEKATWLQGILHWRIQTENPGARRQLSKAMKTLEIEVNAASELAQRASASLDRLGVDFDAYDERITKYGETIDALLARLRSKHQSNGEQLQGLISTALDIHKKRIIAYRSQARYALARALDQQSTGKATTP